MANEKGGKHLLVKRGETITSISTAGSGNDFTKTAHGLAVGDVVKFTAVGGSVAYNTSTFYYIKTVPTADTFTISATISGTAITPAAVSSAVAGTFYKTIAGIRAKSVTLNAEAIDITNGDSDEYKTLLDTSGIRSMSISGSGVYNASTNWQDLVTAHMAGTLTNFMFIESSAGRLYQASFKITSLEMGGDYDGEGNFSISCESSGTLATASLS